MVTHSLERTSLKGEKFIGTCRLCGTQNLTTADALEECENPRGLTEEEDLLEAIDPLWFSAEEHTKLIRQVSSLESELGKAREENERVAAALIDSERWRELHRSEATALAEALRKAYVSVKIASAISGVSAEYDFDELIAYIEPIIEALADD